LERFIRVWLGQNAGPFQDKDGLELVEDADVLGLGLLAGKTWGNPWGKSSGGKRMS
jgi:hypothetical protein